MTNYEGKSRRHATGVLRAGRRLGVGLVLAGSLPAIAAAQSCHPDGDPIEGQVYFFSSGGSYGRAIEEAYFEPFTEECGVEVVHTTGTRNFAQLEQFVESGNVPWDIAATLTDQEYPLGVEKGLFHKLPDGFWTEIEDEMSEGAISEYGAWAAPYSDVMVYSTVGEVEMEGWADFWDTETFPGPRMMQNSPMSLAIALLADGVPADELYPLDLDRAFAKMDELKPSIRAFWSSAEQPIQGTASGEFVAGTTWNGRVITAMKDGKDVGISWEGALLHSSWTFILEGAPNARNAEALMYFMQRPEQQAKLAEITGYTGGNARVAEFLTPEVLETLPTAPEHVAQASVVDGKWWAENISEVQGRLDAWVVAQ